MFNNKDKIFNNKDKMFNNKDINKVESNQIKSNKVRTNRIKSTKIKSNRIKSTKIKSNRIKSTKKAQIATLDGIFASTIFIILIIVSFHYWNSYSLRNYEASTFNELELLTIQLSDLMIKTPGYPNNWETNSSQSPSIIGLAESDRILSKSKLTALQNMSYNSTKTIMNIDRYEYYLLIKQENSSIMELGNIPAKKSARIKRSVMYENKQAAFEFAVW